MIGSEPVFVTVKVNGSAKELAVTVVGLTTAVQESAAAAVGGKVKIITTESVRKSNTIFLRADFMFLV